MRTKGELLDAAQDSRFYGQTLQLDEYLRFRHLFRNIYSFDLRWERCQGLLAALPGVFDLLVLQLSAFDQFLQTLEREL